MKILAFFMLLHVMTFQMLGQDLLLRNDVAVLGSEQSQQLASLLQLEHPLDLTQKLVTYDLVSGKLVEQLDGLVSSQISTLRHGNLIALVGMEVEKNPVGGYQKRNGGKSGLFVFSEDLSVRFFIDSVMEYSWSPDGKRLAFIKGYRLQEKPMFVPTGVFMTELKTNKREQIAESAYDIYWAEADDMIYMQTRNGVYRYDSKVRRLDRTQLRGIYLSFDGMYYFNPGYEGLDFRVYERASGNEVAGLAFRKCTRGLNYHRWLPEASMLVGGFGADTLKVINVNSRAVLKTIDGKMLGYDEKTREIITSKGTKQVFDRTILDVVKTKIF